MAGPRLLFFGLAGAFSLPPLEALVAAGIEVCGVVVPEESRPGGLPVLNPYARRNIVQVAREQGLPLLNIREVAAVRPEVLAVACFDRLIPRTIRELAALAVNVHPSRLPENRGPDPVYWTLKLGHRKTGVTVHVLENRADAGPILAQRQVDVPEGSSYEQLEHMLAELGGQLLVDVVRGFEAGTLEPRPQDESLATNYGRPPRDVFNS
jgi:methionyl-tRNA formyltransferase